MLWFLSLGLLYFAALASCEECVHTEKPGAEGGVKSYTLNQACTLKVIYQKMIGTAMDETSAHYFDAQNLVCNTMTESTDRTFEFTCKKSSGFVFLKPRYLSSAGATTFKITTKESGYDKMAVKIDGKYVSSGGPDLTITKAKDKDNMEAHTGPIEITNAEELFSATYSVSLETMQLKRASDGASLQAIPVTVPAVDLQASFYPQKFFEVIYSEPTTGNFFMAQEAEETQVPTLAYFKKYTLSPREMMTRIYGTEIKEGFMPFMDTTSFGFSSCTGNIPVIMSTAQRDFVGEFLTESVKTNMPKGINLRWRIDDPKHIKKNPKNVEVDPEAQKEIGQPIKELDIPEPKPPILGEDGQPIPLPSESEPAPQPALHTGTTQTVESTTQEEYSGVLKSKIHKKKQKKKKSKKSKRDTQQQEKRTTTDAAVEETDPFTQKIGLTVSIPPLPDKNVVITSDDYVEAKFKDMILTFFPTANIGGVHAFTDILEHTMYFESITIDAANSKVSIKASVADDWQLGAGLINMKGYNFTATVAIAHSEAGMRKAWTYTGEGDATALGDKIISKVEAEDGHLFLVGEMSADNITEITHKAKDVSFLVDGEHFKHLKTLPIEKVFVNTRFDWPVLRILAVYPIEGEDEEGEGEHDAENEEHLSVEFYISKTQAGEPSLGLGVCASKQAYENVMHILFDIPLTGLPWLNFEKICYYFATESSDNSPYVDDQSLAPIANAQGITVTGTLAIPKSCSMKTVESDEIDSIDHLCVLLKNTPFIMRETDKIKGKLTATENLLTASSNIGGFQSLSDDGFLKMKDWNIRIQYKKVPKIAKPSDLPPASTTGVQRKSTLEEHTKTKREAEATPPADSADAEIKEENDLNIGINAVFAIEHTSPQYDLTVNMAKGNIKSAEKTDSVRIRSAEMVVAITDKTQEGTSHAVKLTGAGRVYHVDEGFNMFDFKKELAFEIHGIVFPFTKGVGCTFHAKKLNKFKLRTRGSDTLNQIPTLLQLLGKPQDHVIVTSMRTQGRPIFVYSFEDENVEGHGVAKAHQMTMFANNVRKGNLPGSFKITVSQAEVTYDEKLPPFNFTNGNFQMFASESSRTAGPKIKAVSLAGQNTMPVTLSGFLKTVGISMDVTIQIADDGSFDKNLGSDLKFFIEAPCTVNLVSDGFTNLAGINPRLQVNLMAGKDRIETEMMEYLDFVGTHFADAKSGKLLQDYLKESEGEAANEASRLRETMLQVNNEVQGQIDALKKMHETANEQCATKCQQKGSVDVPGLEWNEQSQKMVLNPALYSTVDIECVVACELEKLDASDGYDKRIEETKKNLDIYDTLMAEVEEIRLAFTEYEQWIKDEKAMFDEEKTEYDEFPDIQKKLNRFKSQGRPAFTLKTFEKTGKLSNWEMEGHNCVKKMDVTYQIFDLENKQMKFTMCFDGQYEFFLAEVILKHWLGEDKMDLYRALMKTYEEQAALHLDNRHKFIHRLKEVLEKKEEESESTTDTVAPGGRREYIAYPRPHMNATKRSAVLKGTKAKAVLDDNTIAIGNRRFFVPKVSLSDRAHLRKNNAPVTRSMDTRYAFLFSSPWAAVGAMDPHTTFSNAQLQVRSLTNASSHCDVLRHVGGEYENMYTSLRSIADAHEKSSSALDNLYQNMKRSITNLKKRAFHSAGDKSDSLYWVNQFERGANLFKTLAPEKVMEHGQGVLGAYKTTFEQALKREGISTNVDGYMDSLKTNFHLSHKKSKVASLRAVQGSASASRLSQGVSYLLNHPHMSVTEARDKIISLKPDVETVTGMARSCV